MIYTDKTASKKTNYVLLIFCLIAQLHVSSAISQVEYAITVIHCDPPDPNINDNINWPETVNHIAWGRVENMVDYADLKGVKLTLQLTPAWVTMILADTSKVSTVQQWQSKGHELAVHHHLHLHSYWDGYTNILSQTAGENGQTYIDSTESFYNQLRVLCGTHGLLTGGVGPAGSPSDSIGVEWTSGMIYQTTNKSGKDPDNFGGRFPDEAFSNVTEGNLYSYLKNISYPVCSLSYCFIEDSLKVDSILNRIDTTSFSVIGGVIHPFNYAKSTQPFKMYLDSISSRFPGNCLSVSKVMQSFGCNSALGNVEVLNQEVENLNSTIYPNPVINEIFARVKSKKHQLFEASIYSLSGQKLKTFYNGYILEGEHTLRTFVGSLNPGLYVVQLVSENKVEEVSFLKI